MSKLTVDYISDMHLSFYLQATSNGYDVKQMESFIAKNIAPKVQGEVLVIAGDLTEFTRSGFKFLELCSKYYSKVFFVAGNHEYYLSSIFFSGMKKEYGSESLEKIYELCELCNATDKIVMLDRLNENNGIYEYKGFKIAGDTLWYIPTTFRSWWFYYISSNDSRFIKSMLSRKQKIINLHETSMDWYESLPDDIDLMITHVPPIKSRMSSCYYVDVDDFKAPVWIYGHDHIEKDETIGNTHFVSNPWGYESKDFAVKTLTLKKGH